MKLGHVHLKVRNLERSVAFYRELFGLKVTEQAGEAYAFLTDGREHHTIALQQVGATAPSPPERGVGLYHVAFEVDSRAAFEEAYRKLSAMGTDAVLVDHRISWAMYFDDPDGNGLEIYWDTRTEPTGRKLWHGENRPLRVTANGLVPVGR